MFDIVFEKDKLYTVLGVVDRPWELYDRLFLVYKSYIVYLAGFNCIVLNPFKGTGDGTLKCLLRKLLTFIVAFYDI